MGPSIAVLRIIGWTRTNCARQRDSGWAVGNGGQASAPHRDR